MYAIVEVGSKQYTVGKDDVIEVEKIEIAGGSDVTIDKVLLVSDEEGVKVGRPYLKGAAVSAKVLAQVKDDKKLIYKYRRRKSSDNLKGHRQKLTRLKITGIKA
jgi:large subunit ribosomal protein L21